MTIFFEKKFSRKTDFINKRLYQVLTDSFRQSAISDIQGENSKLKYYSSFKSTAGLERYLTLVKDIKHKNALSKFRLSCHRLNIEIGRYTRIPRNERTCPFCPGEVEDEIHFSLRCQAYNELRESLFNYVGFITPNFINFTEQLKSHHLMTHIESMSAVARFIYDASVTREANM